MPYIFGIIFLLLGLFMTIFPKQSLKQNDRNVQGKMEKARRNGIILVVVAIIFVVATFIISKPSDNKLKDKESNQFSGLCTVLGYKITDYQNKKIDWSSFIVSVENYYNEQCSGNENDLCLNMHFMITQDIKTDEIKDAYITELKVQCQKINDLNK